MSESPLPDGPHRREIRSFVRREGRMTDAQKDSMARLWSRYGVESPVAGTRLDLAALFGRAAPKVFEIGFGAGDALLFRAEQSPERDYLGAEVHRPGVGRVLHRAEKAALTNVRTVCDDAVAVLRDWLSEASLDELILEFPDPWHKKRHHKRRIVQPVFVELAASRLKPGGVFRLATDWAPYAEHMREVLDASPWFDGGPVPRPDSRPVTRFEARGERLGHAMADFCYRRR